MKSWTVCVNPESQMNMKKQDREISSSIKMLISHSGVRLPHKQSRRGEKNWASTVWSHGKGEEGSGLQMTQHLKKHPGIFLKSF